MILFLQGSSLKNLICFKKSIYTWFQIFICNWKDIYQDTLLMNIYINDK